MCPGTSAPPSAAHLTVSLILCSPKSNARGEAPWRASCQHKKPFMGLGQRHGSCWEERKRVVFPWQGVIDLASRQLFDSLPIWPLLIFDCLPLMIIWYDIGHTWSIRPQTVSHSFLNAKHFFSQEDGSILVWGNSSTCTYPCCLWCLGGRKEMSKNHDVEVHYRPLHAHYK